MDIVKIININYQDLLNFILGQNNQKTILLSLLENNFFIISVFLNKSIKPIDIELIKNFKHHYNLDIEFKFIIENDIDIDHFKLIQSFFEEEEISLYPHYNRHNYTFFEKNIFLEEHDIMNIEPLDQKHLFKRKKINENYFSKLIFTWDGNIFSNIHSTNIGNIQTLKNNSLHEIIFNELTNNGVWFRTREQVYPCKNCIYNIFCPPITNYEFVMNRNNLCHYFN